MLCRGAQRGGCEGDGLVFSLFTEAAAAGGGRAEVEFELQSNTLRGVPAESLPPFLRPDAADSQDGVISFEPSEGVAFFTQLALALGKEPAPPS